MDRYNKNGGITKTKFKTFDLNNNIVFRIRNEKVSNLTYK